MGASSGIGVMDGLRQLVFFVDGFGRARVGGEICEKLWPLSVGEEVAELDSEADMFGDVVAADFGEVGGDGEVDSRRRTAACWACNAI